MKKITLICDKCKHEETGESEYKIKGSGWREVSVKTGMHSSDRALKEYLFCPECCKQLGIAIEESTIEQCHSLADRLIECIVEIVAENRRGY